MSQTTNQTPETVETAQTEMVTTDEILTEQGEESEPEPILDAPPVKEDEPPTVASITAKEATSQLRQILKDYNIWGESENDDDALKVKDSTGTLTDEAILTADASMRKKASGEKKYKAPERVIQRCSLTEIFKKLISSTLMKLEQLQPPNTRDNILSYHRIGNELEFYTGIFSVFCKLGDSVVAYVRDDIDDPYTTLFIYGTSTDGRSVSVSTLLIEN